VLGNEAFASFLCCTVAVHSGWPEFPVCGGKSSSRGSEGARAASHGATRLKCDNATFPPSGRLPFEKLDRAQNDDYDIRNEGPQTRAVTTVPGRGRVSLFSHHHARSLSARFNFVWLI
jgi:hypothetical protein